MFRLRRDNCLPPAPATGQLRRKMCHWHFIARTLSDSASSYRSTANSAAARSSEHCLILNRLRKRSDAFRVEESNRGMASLSCELGRNHTVVLFVTTVSIVQVIGNACYQYKFPQRRFIGACPRTKANRLAPLVTSIQLSPFSVG